jgi:hypothetical protein
MAKALFKIFTAIHADLRKIIQEKTKETLKRKGYNIKQERLF